MWQVRGEPEVFAELPGELGHANRPLRLGPDGWHEVQHASKSVPGGTYRMLDTMARARRTAGPAHARTSLDAVALDGVEAVRSVAVRLPRVCAVAPCYGWLGKGRRAS